MKFLVCFLLLLTTSVALAAQEPPPNLALDRLKGPVRTIKSGTVGFVLKDGKRVENTRRVAKILRFDERGNRTEATTLDSDGTVSERLVYSYDALGRNTGYEEYYRLAGKAMGDPRRHIYTLDHNGKIVERISYEADGSVGPRFNYKYDSKGNKLEDSFTSWTGGRIGRTSYTYDADGHVLTHTDYDADGAVSWKTIDSYDAAGRRVEWEQYQEQVLRYKKLFRYDHKGRIAEEETFVFDVSRAVNSHGPEPGKVVYTYNDKRHSTEIATYDPAGALKLREVHTYDKHDNQVGRELFNADGSARPTEVAFFDEKRAVKLSGKSHTQFQYDSHGNWTKKVYLILPDGAQEPQPWRADFRNITYY